MDNINELAAALAKAQSKMEGATKDTANPFFKSKYADLASVTGAVRSGLDGTGLAYVQIAHDQPDCAAIETVILHESGQSVSCGIVRVPVAKQDAQGYGSAMTYARRYSLAAAFGVAPEDDDGNAATKAKPLHTPAAQSAAIHAVIGMDASTLTGIERAAKKINEIAASNPTEASRMFYDEDLTGDEQTAVWDKLAPATKKLISRKAA